MGKAGEKVVAAIVEAATRLHHRGAASMHQANQAHSSGSNSTINVAHGTQAGHQPLSIVPVPTSDCLHEVYHAGLPINDSLPTSTTPSVAEVPAPPSLEVSK
jgi:hypothetical protein